MEAVKEYECPSCGGSLEFNPINQDWKCIYCMSEFTKGDIEDKHDHKTHIDQETPELNSYTCTSCGAELLADDTTSATFCLYCKNHSIIKNRFSGKFQPKRVIPFKLTKNQAEEIYRNWIKKRLFAPTEFKKKEEIEKVSGIYAPFWLFDCKGNGFINGEATKVSTWTQGDYQYTRTRYYKFLRRGNADYLKIPVDASKKLDDKFMHMIEPYDYKALKDFSMEYMAGFLAEKYDVEEPESQNVMKTRVEKYLADRLDGTVGGYSTHFIHSREMDLSNVVSQYSLLPVYLLNNKYNGKDHIFIINGQTGKVVGDTPISRVRQLQFMAALAATIWVVVVLGGALFV